MNGAEIRTSPKNARKPQTRGLALRAAILAVAQEYDRLSVRQLYYQLVARGVIEKTEQTYKRVCDASAQLRLDGSPADRRAHHVAGPPLVSSLHALPTGVTSGGEAPWQATKAASN